MDKKNRFPEVVNMPANNVLEIFFAMCIKHRDRFGIKGTPKGDDCNVLSCGTGCPLKLLGERLEQIDVELEAKWRAEDKKARVAQLEEG